jgi:hypothetical protein
MGVEILKDTTPQRWGCPQATANQPVAAQRLFRAASREAADKDRPRPAAIAVRMSFLARPPGIVDRARTPPEWVNRWCPVVVDLQPGDCLFQVNDRQ